MTKFKSGFTIVELLVVIVVIGILAAITIVSYTGISQRAKEASLQSDLDNASKQIKLFQVTEPSGNYPIGNVCPTPGATGICLKTSGSNYYTYSVSNGSNPKTFTLDATNGATTYRITNDSTPVAVDNLTCPSGFIPVPGSATYSTHDFCVMKYEAKADDNGDGIGDTTYNTGSNTWPANTYPISATRKLVSTPAGYPVALISQNTAIAAASNASFVTGCTSGCHLITEAEWMTIAQNVLNVPSNWSSGIVGTGYIFSGHNDNDPASTALVADANDANGYSGTNDSSGDAGVTNGMIGNTQRRTLTLSNGEVIWDLAGNVYEWTSGTAQTPIVQPGVTSAGWNWREWTVILANNQGTLPINPSPSGTGIANAGTWDSTNGIGKIYSSSDAMSLYGFRRGGDWNNDSDVGVFALYLGSYPTSSNTAFGFRVSR